MEIEAGHLVQQRGYLNVKKLNSKK